MSEVVEKDLPNNWAWATFGDVAELIRGVNYKKPDASKEPEADKLPILRANNIGYGLNFNDLVYVPEKLIKDEQHIKKGDIIIAMSSGSKHLVGKAAQANDNFNGGYGAFCANLRVTTEIDPKYVAYFYSSRENIKRITGLSKGSNINNLKREHILNAPIPVAPPEQQKRIVAKIEELFSHIDAGIEALKKAKQLLKQYRQSVLKAAVTGELTKEWREANKAKLEPASQLLERILKERRQKWEEQQNEQFKAKGKMPKDDGWKEKYKEPEVLGINEIEVTDGWVTCAFEQLITELKNGISKKPTEESGLAIFRISAVRPMFVNKEDVRYLPNDFNSTGFEIENDDLLFTRYNGNPELVGVCGKVKGLQRKIVYPDKIMRARLVSNSSLSSDYLELSLNCGVSKTFIRSVTKTTAGQSGVAGGDVKKCPVVLPCFLEQQKIAEIVDEKTSAIMHLQDAVDFQLIKAEKNKQSILASAFSNNLFKELT